MKKIKFLSVIAVFALVFSSCSNEESIGLENENANLLKTYKIKRDATGAYSIDFNVSENTKVEKVVDNNGNTSQFLLFSSDINSSKKITQNLTIDGEQLEIGFVDSKTNSSPNIKIIDDNLSVAKKSNDNIKLSSYSIEANEDGTYQLDFEVNDNVSVDFVYNESISTYEVHLEDGNSSESNFSRTLESVIGGLLKIDFVNHNTNSNAKTQETFLTRKPKVIVDNFGGN